MNIQLGDRIFHKQPYNSEYGCDIFKCLEVEKVLLGPDNNESFFVLKSDQIIFNAETGTREFATFYLPISELEERLGKDLFLCHDEKKNDE